MTDLKMESNILLMPVGQNEYVDEISDTYIKIYIREELKRGRTRHTSIFGLDEDQLHELNDTLKSALHCNGVVVEDRNGVHLKLRGFHCQAVSDLLLERGVTVDQHEERVQCVKAYEDSSKKRALIDANEQYGRVKNYVGHGSFIVRCADQKERLCLVRGKFRSHGHGHSDPRPMKAKQMRACFRTGDEVLVDLRDFETSAQEKCDLIEMYPAAAGAGAGAGAHPHPRHLRGGRGRGQGREGRKSHAAQKFSQSMADLDDD